MDSNNVCDNIRIEKVTLNAGCGRDASRVDKSFLLFEKITSQKPVKTFSKKRIPAWDLRPGLPIGVKVTVRGKNAESLLKRLLGGVENLSSKAFDNQGNFSFGLKEYISIPGLEYDHDIGILGFDVAVTLERIGFRVKKRRSKPASLPTRKKIGKSDAMEFIKSTFGKEIAK